MAQQSVTGPEEPVLSTVLISTLRVMWFRSANSHTGPQLYAASQAGQMAATDYALPFENRLRLSGRPQMESGPWSDELWSGCSGLISSDLVRDYASVPRFIFAPITSTRTGDHRPQRFRVR